MKLSRRYLWSIPLAAGLAAGGLFMSQRGTSAPSPANGRADQPADLKPAVNLPISQVVLFNSGVGHFTRSGEVEGDARIDLTFPEQEVNDLIKSMTLRDFSPNGKVAAVTYDSHDPIDRTLASFAINLNHSPSLAQILTQARGEQVEVALLGTSSQPGNLVGKIIGVEQQLVPSKDGPPVPVTILNLWCAEGMRAIKLSEVQRLRFANAVIENEVRRALETLAMSHDAQKKAVSLHFSGEGKRKVEVGYVVENPIWKTSYRLVLAKDGDHKPFLQGWAVVENPTDEDWQKVTMALVSGRPISFLMDLYNPLYVSRPTVEPELFASLRPPTYGGPLLDFKKIMDKGADDKAKLDDSTRDRENEKLAAPLRSARPAPDTGIMGGSGAGGGFGYKVDPQHRQFARQAAEKLSEDLRLGQSVQSIASASALGDYYRYVIDRPVDLARQKSALLPIVNMDVEGKRVSIYNPAVQPKHPLLGLRFKNTTGMPLTQGPVTVFEGSVYAGDTRVMDLQPDEERLVSYAIDLGTEVAMKRGANTSRITSVKAVKGWVFTNTVNREEVTYDVSNRSTTDRTLLIEVPNRKGQNFKFIGDNKPKEEAADVFRFELAVGSKKNLTYTVTEEQPVESRVQLTNGADDQIRYFLSLKEAPQTLKDRLREAMKVKGTWDKVRQDIAAADTRVQTITADQKRLRENMRELPKESKLFEKYLKTLEDQEKEMEDLQAKLKTLHAEEVVSRKAYDEFLANLSAD